MDATTNNNQLPSYHDSTHAPAGEHPPSYDDAIFNKEVGYKTVVRAFKSVCEAEMTKSKKRMDGIMLGAMFAMSNEDAMKLERRKEMLLVYYVKNTMTEWNQSRGNYLITHTNRGMDALVDPDRDLFSIGLVETIRDDTTYEVLIKLLDEMKFRGIKVIGRSARVTQTC
jgi:hypothetical protein